MIGTHVRVAPPIVPVGLIAAIAVAVGIGTAIGLTQSVLPLVVLVTGLGVIAIALRPELATVLFAFALYLNLPDVAVAFHDVPFAVGAGFVGLLAIPLAVWWLRTGAIVTWTAGLLPLLAFAGVALASALASANLDVALSWLVTFAAEGLLLYLLVTSVIRTHRTLEQVVWALLAAGALMAGLSIFQEVTQSYGTSFGGLAQITSRGIVVDETAIGEIRQPRLSGPIGEQNRYAQVLLALIPLAVYEIRQHGRSLAGGAASVAGVLILGGMTLTYSRGAMVGLALIAVAMLMLGYVRGKRLVVVVLLAGVGVLTAGPTLIDRVASLAAVEDAFAPDDTSGDGSLRFRATVNLAAWNVFMDHPLLGVGPGHFEAEYSASYANETGLDSFPSASQRPAHNLYLGIAADFGILGLTAFLFAIGVVGVRLFRARQWWWRRVQSRSDLATAFGLALLSYLVTGLFLHLAYMRFFWFLFALACTVIWVLERDRRTMELAPVADRPDVSQQAAG